MDMLGTDSSSAIDHTLKFLNLEFAYRFPSEYI
jgi:hypothetical protein